MHESIRKNKADRPSNGVSQEEAAGFHMGWVGPLPQK